MKSVLAGLALAALATPGLANPYEASMRDYLESELLIWAFDPVIIEAVRAHNVETAGIDQAWIDAADLRWRAEVGSANQPTIGPVLNNIASDFLRAQIEASAGTVVEVFIMDANGLNVAAAVPTSDYWQGDEAKFQQTFDVGPGAVFVDEVEFDESVQAYLGQVSLTLTDPETNEPIGAMTVGLNAEMLY
ncbi:hypothetical protein [Pseudooceanicola algae]|uniref:Uncharacterized protein n=1 Tax=Pseudooceanicola algae TaxID=1537215 RepID=A0A418SCH4_9RHOB|nr:hypothetical protein [Pseudooceanicola algae]QPM90106.1 hypothetical protein PSAL_013400 [Pseudooceanicola algae]